MPQLMPLMWVLTTIMILYIFMMLINLYSYISMYDLKGSFKKGFEVKLVNMLW